MSYKEFEQELLDFVKSCHGEYKGCTLQVIEQKLALGFECVQARVAFEDAYDMWRFGEYGAYEELLDAIKADPMKPQIEKWSKQLSKEKILEGVLPVLQQLKPEGLRRRWLGVWVYYRYQLTEDYSFAISEKVAAHFDISEEELYQAARRNVPKPELMNVYELIGHTNSMYPAMIALSTGNWGANALMHKGALTNLAESFGSDLCILPSSIYEVIAISAEGSEPENVARMISEVNRFNVKEEERLADKPFWYKLEEGKLVGPNGEEEEW